MGKNFNRINDQNFSIDVLLAGLLNSFDRDIREYPENGRTQGITPREKNEIKGINLPSDVKDDRNKVIQELISILNTAFTYQEEKLFSQSENIIGDARHILIGERGITEWILMSRVTRIESRLLKDFLKGQKDLIPYDFYKLTNVFENYLIELSKKIKKDTRKIANEDFVRHP